MAKSQLTEAQMLEGLESAKVSDIYNSLTELRLKYVCNVIKMRKLSARQGVLKKVIAHIEHPKFCNMALSIISNCSNDEYLRQDIIKHKGVVPLVRTLKGLANHEILNRACRALANIASSDKGLVMVLESQVIDNIVTFLKSATVEDHQITCMRALRIIGRKKEHRRYLIRSNAIYAIARQILSDTVNVVAASAKTLALLSQSCTTNAAQQIMRAEILSKLVSLCEDQKYLVNNFLCYNALTILENLTRVSEMREELGDVGAFPLFIKIANSDDTTQNVQSAILALCFCCGDYYGRSQIRELGGLEALVKILKCHRFEHIYVQVIAGITQLCSEAYNTSTLRKLKIYETLLDKVKTIISRHKPHQETKPFLLVRSKFLNSKVDAKEQLEGLQKTSVDPKLSQNSSNNTSPVFSIHSPTYQGVKSSESTSATPTYSYFMGNTSPLATQLNSPEYYSFEWSPGSPRSCSSLPGPWSPASSSSDMQGACWSPAMSSKSATPESSSEDECDGKDRHHGHSQSPIVDAASMASTSSSKDGSTLCSVAEENTLILNKFDNSQESLYSTNTSSSDGLSAQSTSSHVEEPQPKKRKLDLLPDADKPVSVESEFLNLIKNTCEKDLPKAPKHDQRVEQADKQLVNYILILLSQLTRIFLVSDFWTTMEDLDLTVFVQYLAVVSPTNVRVMKILKNLISSPHCFERLVADGFFRNLHKMMEPPHDKAKCDHCLALFETRLSIHDVTKIMIKKDQFAVSVIKNATQSNNWKLCLNGFDLIARFINVRNDISIYFCGRGLTLFENMLNNIDDDELYEIAALTLIQVWNNLDMTVHLDINRPTDTISSCDDCSYAQSLSSTSCLVELVANDGNNVLAARNVLCEQSNYFSSLLEGQFVEAKQDVVSLPSVNSQILLYVVHYLHGCRVGLCPSLTKIPLTDVDSFLQAADMYVLDSLKQHMVDNLLNRLPDTRADIVFELVKTYGNDKNMQDLFTLIMDSSTLSNNGITFLLKKYPSDILSFFKNFISANGLL